MEDLGEYVYVVESERSFQFEGDEVWRLWNSMSRVSKVLINGLGMREEVR